MPSTGCHRRCVHADDAWRPSGLCESEERADFGVVCEDLLRWLELTERLARDAAQTRDMDSVSAGNSGCRDHPRTSPSTPGTLRGSGWRGPTSHGVLCTGVVIRAADRAPALDAAQSRDTDSTSAGNGGCRDHRALHLRRSEPFGDRTAGGSRLTV